MGPQPIRLVFAHVSIRPSELHLALPHGGQDLPMISTQRKSIHAFMPCMSEQVERWLRKQWRVQGRQFPRGYILDRRRRYTNIYIHILHSVSLSLDGLICEIKSTVPILLILNSFRTTHLQHGHGGACRITTISKPSYRDRRKLQEG